MNIEEKVKNNFLYYKNVNEKQILEIAKSQFFAFDTENSPIFPNDITKKYNLKEVEYTTLDVFNPKNENEILTTLLKNKQITTKIYIWQFGGTNSDLVIWGNTIEEFREFTNEIVKTRIENNIIFKNQEINTLVTYVHNLSWDIEFFKYYFKENGFVQLQTTQNINSFDDRRLQQYIDKQKTNSFDIMESDGIVRTGLIQFDSFKYNKKVKNGKKKNGTQNYKNKEIEVVSTIDFRDSVKISPMSLKKISEDLIEVDKMYIKDGSKYKYNLVRNCEKYKPNLEDSIYQYCDIYLLKEYLKQIIIGMYVNNGINPFSISQIAFDSILKENYKDNVLRKKYRLETDKRELTDRQIYERHFALEEISKSYKIKEYIDLSYKGGHTLSSSYHVNIGTSYDEKMKNIKSRKNHLKENKLIENIKKEFIIKGSSMDITSSYPSQMCLKPLPFGEPIYSKGKFKDFIFDENENYNLHLVTIAFDGFTSINPHNKFGLNLKMLNLSPEHKEYLQLGINDSPTSNYCKTDFVGKNHIEVTNKERKKLIDKYKGRNFIVTLTNFELDEWMENFTFYCEDNDIIREKIEYIDYLSFQSEVGHFEKGLMHFFKMKEENDKKDGNKTLKEIAKLIINSFYGKHCSNSEREQRFYDFSKDVIAFKKIGDNRENIIEWFDKKLYAKSYGSFVTSYGRVQLRETCRKIGSHLFIYADTDSLKFCLSKEELLKICKEKNINISTCKEEKRLGYWDFEYEFEDFKVVGLKKYMYKKKGENDFITKCAGLPKDVRNQIKEKEDFAINKVFVKNQKKKVIGGNILVPIKYKLNDLLL